MIETILSVTFGITTLTFLYSTFNLYRKVDRLEQWVDATYLSITNTIDEMDKIDSTGHFEADDEVGVVFNQLKDTINKLDKITEE